MDFYCDALMYFHSGVDNALVLKVRRLLSSLWPEIVRLAEALDRDGELVGAGHIKSIVRLPSWLT
jgi:hypothetical protein